jgi:predicted TIM-barrel fold metal-dependent hydrolase
MEDPSLYVKMSAPYLFSKSTGFPEFDSLVIALLSARNGERVVLSSDWPHTQSRGYDVHPFMQQVAYWYHHDEEFLKKVFRDNARVLGHASP